MEAHGCSDKT